jgi:putative ATPase
MHLCNAPIAVLAELGHGQGYRYAHDEPNAYAAGETYLPEEMVDPHWYRPVPRGLELTIREKLTNLQAQDDAYSGRRTLPGSPPTTR